MTRSLNYSVHHGPQAVVILQEALLDDPDDSSKVDHHIRFTHVRDCQTEAEARTLIDGIPSTLDESVEKVWGLSLPTKGKVRTGIYCLDLTTAGGQNVAKMTRLHGGSLDIEQIHDPETLKVEKLRRETVAHILNEQHEPALYTAYNVPVPHGQLPVWTNERHEHIGAKLLGGWGHGKNLMPPEWHKP
jgi:hypothetical protein